MSVWLDVRGRARLDVRLIRAKDNPPVLAVYVRSVSYKTDPRHLWEHVLSIDGKDDTWLDAREERKQAIRGVAQMAALKLGGIAFRLRSKPR